MAKCCDEWWASLDDHMKEWVHYYFYDIIERLPIPREDIHEMHEFRFKVELGGEINERKRQ